MRAFQQMNVSQTCNTMSLDEGTTRGDRKLEKRIKRQVMDVSEAAAQASPINMRRSIRACQLPVGRVNEGKQLKTWPLNTSPEKV